MDRIDPVSAVRRCLLQPCLLFLALKEPLGRSQSTAYCSSFFVRWIVCVLLRTAAVCYVLPKGPGLSREQGRDRDRVCGGVGASAPKSVDGWAERKINLTLE